MGGTPGNKGGGRRPDEVKALAREHTAESISTLVEVMRTGQDASRVKAAIALIEIGWGKPKQQNEITGTENGPIRITFG